MQFDSAPTTVCSALLGQGTYIPTDTEIHTNNTHDAIVFVDRVLFSSVSYYAFSRLHVADHPRAYNELLDALKWLYPSLAHKLRIDRKWEGVIAATLRCVVICDLI